MRLLLCRSLVFNCIDVGIGALKSCQFKLVLLGDSAVGKSVGNVASAQERAMEE
jgi:hypothetical protein